MISIYYPSKFHPSFPSTHNEIPSSKHIRAYRRYPLGICTLYIPFPYTILYIYCQCIMCTQPEPDQRKRSAPRLSNQFSVFAVVRAKNAFGFFFFHLPCTDVWVSIRVYNPIHIHFHVLANVYNTIYIYDISHYIVVCMCVYVLSVE